jgi:hypothetical protein
MRGGDVFFIPLKKTQSRNIEEKMGDVVVLAFSSRSDLIQAPQRATPPEYAHVQHTNKSSSLVK